MNYRIYLKTPEMNNYGAIGGKSICRNLIYAEMWESLDIATHAIKDLIRINPKSWKWQIRNINNKIIIKSEELTNV